MNDLTTNLKNDFFKAGVGYLILVLCFCYPVLQGKIITQTDYLNFISPWDAVSGFQSDEPSNTHLQDQSTEFFPFFMEAKEQLSEGIFPLWNPYIFAGNPLWANTQSALMYPLNWFQYLLPAPVGFTISALLKLFLGSFLTYVFLRKIKVEHVPAFYAGTAFGFCAFTVFWLNHPHTNIVCLIPLCFYMTEKIAESSDSRATYVFALVVALTLFSGHVEIAFITAVACGLYYLIRLIQHGRLSFSKLLKFLYVYVLGLLLAAVLIFPFVEFLFNTAIWSERSVTKQLTIPTSGLISIFWGNFFKAEGWPPNNVGFHAFSPYVGILTCFLAIFAFHKRVPHVLAFGILLVLSLCVAFSVNPFSFVVQKLPLFNHLPLFYFSVLAAFSLSVLAALGLQNILKGGLTPIKILSTVLLCLSILVVISSFWSPGKLSPLLESENTLMAALQNHGFQVMLYLAGLSILLCMNLKYQKNLGYLYVLLLFFDLWVQGHSWNPVVDYETSIPRKTPPSIEYLHQQERPFRATAYNYILKPSTNMLAQIHDVRGYDVPVIDRYHTFFNQALKGNDAFWYYDFKKFDATVLPFLNMLNVKYLLSKKDLADAIPEGIDLVYDKEIKIYENNKAMGLAFFVDRIEAVESPEEALDTTIERKSELNSLAIIEASEKVTYTELEESPVTEVNKIAYKSIQPNLIELSVETDKPKFLVLSQANYPGWKAKVNGEKTTIFTANYILQAIKIPAGRHQVTFAYNPLSFTLGWIVSLSLFMIVLWKIRKKTK